MRLKGELLVVVPWVVILALGGAADARKPIVAVFEIQTSKRVRLSREAKSNLSVYLASRLTSSGAYEVVAKEMLRAALRKKKKESYKRCYKQSCQIAIGQELSADKSLASRIMKIGKKCVVTVALYDLKKATTEKGADAQGGCSEEALMVAVKTAVAKLVAPSAQSKDRAPMVRVPAGAFLRGSRSGKADEKPQRRITLAAFSIDKHEVTVAQYRRCVRAGRCSTHHLEGYQRSGKKYRKSKYCNWGRSGRQQHPINCLDWSQAKTYCSWAGKRLPTEAEWEKAARGTDGRRFPWGNMTASCKRAVMNDGGRGCGRKSTGAVGSKSPAGDSPFGAQDMAGNVYEWTADWYNKSYYRGSPARNPKGPSRGTGRVVRGGSWTYDARYLRAADRYGLEPAYRNDHIGFRCARGSP